MSGESGSGEKTEQPTPKRLRDARQKGQVGRSKEVAGTAGLAIILGYIWIRADSLRDSFAELILVAASAASLPFASGLARMVDAATHVAMDLVLPIIAIAVVAAILGNIVQVGILFAAEAIKPSMKKMNPASALKRIVSPKNFIDFGKNIIKASLLGLVITMVLRHGLGDLILAGSCGLGCTVGVFGSLMGYIIAFSIGIFIVAAGVDYALERWQYIKGLMMTKDEVKREYKEMEGDPQIKGRRRQLHRDLLAVNVIQSTQRATAVVTNPTHLAVALRYDRNEAPLPVILAKGANLFARQIIEVAEDNDVPLMQNVDLARALYERGEIDQLIPADLIEPVAEVLRWVRRLARERSAA